MEFYAHALNPETFWNLADHLWRLQRVLIKIEHSFTVRADEVVMRFRDGIYPERTMMQAEFAQYAAFDKGVQRLVNGS